MAIIHDMGDLEKEITSDGVISIIELSVYNVYQGSYSNNIYHIQLF